jgi:hypothetical protein
MKAKDIWPDSRMAKAALPPPPPVVRPDTETITSRVASVEQYGVMTLYRLHDDPEGRLLRTGLPSHTRTLRHAMTYPDEVVKVTLKRVNGRWTTMEVEL